jgi:hypothetical protein
MLFVQLLLPDLSRIASLFAIGAVGEVVFIGWLLFRGAGTTSRDS